MRYLKLWFSIGISQPAKKSLNPVYIIPKNLDFVEIPGENDQKTRITWIFGNPNPWKFGGHKNNGNSDYFPIRSFNFIDYNYYCKKSLKFFPLEIYN